MSTPALLLTPPLHNFTSNVTTTELPSTCNNNKKPKPNPKPKKSTITVCMEVAKPQQPATCFGLKNLMETFTVDVQRAEGRPLIAPFTTASSRLDRVENVAVRVELSKGCVGWGESPVLPHVTAEDQPTCLAKAADACQLLKHSSGKTLGILLSEINGMLPGHAFASELRLRSFSSSYYSVNWISQCKKFLPCVV